MVKATIRFNDYVAVIPMIQNVYAVDKEHTGYFFGFKYTSGVFEYISYKTKGEAEKEFTRLLDAIDQYWQRK